MVERVRAFWKGQLKLALVTFPVQLVTAFSKEGTLPFNLIHRDTKQRIRYEKTVPGVQHVDKKDIVFGYEIEPGNYVLLENEEIDELKLRTRHTIELVQFVDACEIDPLYFEKPYYVLPEGEDAEEPYCVLRDTLREDGKVGVGQLTLRGKENLVALKPSGNGLSLETLHYESEIKDADTIFASIKKTKSRADLISMAKELIDKRTSPFDPSAYKNHYVEALRELVKSKLKGRGAVTVEEPEAPEGGKVIDFMEALKKSVGKSGEKTKPTPRPRRTKAATRARRHRTG